MERLLIALIASLLIPLAQGDCGFPGRPESGSVRHNGAEIQPDHFKIKVGDKVVYSCNSDRRFKGNRERLCQSNGTWSGDLPICLENVAGLAKLRGNLGSNCSLESYQDGPMGRCAVGCFESGNSLHFEFSEYHNIDGIRFTGKEINHVRAKLVSADGLYAPEEIRIQRTETESEVYFTFIDSRRSWRTINVTFGPQGRADVCEIEIYAILESCGHPEEPANGRVALIDNRAWYQCDQGYEISGPILNNCTRGRWSGQQSICQYRSDFSWKWLLIGAGGASALYTLCMFGIIIRASKLLMQRDHRNAIERNRTPSANEFKVINFERERISVPLSADQSEPIYDELDAVGVVAYSRSDRVDSSGYLAPIHGQKVN